MAVLQSSLFGLAGVFPMSCMSSLVSGQAISGVFSSLARIVSLLVAEEPVTSGFVYFTISDVFFLISIGCYVCLTRGVSRGVGCGLTTLGRVVPSCSAG